MQPEITVTKENTCVYPQHSHRVWEYMLYKKGTGTLVTQQGEFPFAPGTLILVPPGVRHGSRAEESFVNICIHTESAPSPEHSAIFAIPKAGEEIQALFDLIRKFYFHADFPKDAIPSLIFALRRLLSQQVGGSPANSLVTELHAYLSENFQSPECSVQTVLQKYGYSEDYCRLRFQARFGCTPHAFLTDLRIQHARLLLTSEDGKHLKIQDIAQLCGYADSLYFSRAFKQRFGVSPLGYRKIIG